MLNETLISEIDKVPLSPNDIITILPEILEVLDK